MATHKVIQDIEAEDKLLGPLTLRQFIYAVIVVVTGFIAFKVAFVAWYLALPLVPPILLFAVLAAPFGHDQPSEIWLLAKIRFFLKPRLRIWDQSGIKQLVTITVPKMAEKHYSDGLSQTEVRSRLRALADTIDSRGWAVKNVNVNLSGLPPMAAVAAGSDRLVDVSSLPQEVPSIDITASDDIMDPQSNPRAQQLDQMMVASAQSHRQEAVSRMKQPAQDTTQPAADDYWFMHQHDTAELSNPDYATFGARTIAPGMNVSDQPTASKLSPEEEAVLEHIREQKAAFPTAAYGHMKVIDPLGQRHSQTPVPGNPQSSAPSSPVNNSQKTDDRRQTTSSTATEPDILELASNDDLNVATLAREAGRKRKKHPPTDEVVISLH